MDRSTYNQGQNAKYDMGINEDDVAQTVIARGPGAVCYGIGAYNSEGMLSPNPNSGIYEADTARTLNATEVHGICYAEGLDAYNQASTGDKAMAIRSVRADSEHLPCVVQTIALEGNGQRPSHQGDGYAETDKSYTLNATEVHGVCYETSDGEIAGTLVVGETTYIDTTHADDVVRVDTVTAPLQARDYNGGKYVLGQDRVRYIVRRLTPMECERLQGFPDHWTDIGDWVDSKGKKHKGDADAPRYQALGNSIALPSWAWVIKRLCGQYERPATMASLFDGIGGFPLIWEQINGRGTCLWASEIEEFPISVTKERIG